MRTWRTVSLVLKGSAQFFFRDLFCALFMLGFLMVSLILLLLGREGGVVFSCFAHGSMSISLCSLFKMYFYL